MKIALLVAMTKELNLILPYVKDIKKETFEGTTYYLGTLCSHDVILAHCGIGKVNAAIGTYQLITRYHPDLMLNSGVACGFGENSKPGDIFIATEVTYHDVWCGFDSKYGAADGFPQFMKCDEQIINLAHKNIINAIYGLICSGDIFISKKSEALEIMSHFPQVKAGDMESGAIAQTCLMLGVPFNIIRIISDNPSTGNNSNEYKDFWEKAPENTFETLLKILQSLK